jgi:GlpG protein
MYWLFFLGRLIEARKGSLFLLAFVLVIAIPSNLAQFILSGPLFGGMSGVVYGLFGYIWMKGRFAPREGLALDPTTVVIMLVWLVLGYLGMMNMANTVHTVGLIVGVTWGYLTSTR